MNSLKNKVKILLDTTYMLPIVGIEVEGIEETLYKLRNLFNRNLIEVYYTPFNLLEISGKLSRIKYDRKRVKLGLKSIKDSFKNIVPTMKGYLIALELKKSGFKDLIDLLLYATSLTRKIYFLTRDKELVEFLKENNKPLEYVLFEREFLNKF